VDSSLKFTTLEPYGWSVDSGAGAESYYDDDSAKSYDTLDDDGESWMQAIVDYDSAEALKFWWKADFELNTDYLEFYIDNTLQHRITDQTEWTQMTYTIPAGIHTFKWRFVKDDADLCNYSI